MVLGPGHLKAQPQSLQSPPAGLNADRHAPTVADAGGDLRAGPEAAVVGPTLEGLEQRGLLFGGKLGLTAVVETPLIGQAIGSIGIPPWMMRTQAGVRPS